MYNKTRGPVSDKPFAFVTVEQGAQTATPPMHDRYVAGQRSGVISGTILAVTPVTVATGILELEEALSSKGQKSFPLVREVTRLDGTLCIPGSSLKGCIRSMVEASTKSCISKGRDNPDNLRECRVGSQRNQCCPACSIFGAMGYLSRVSFADAVLKEGTSSIVQVPALFGPRAKRGESTVRRKFYYNHTKAASGEIPTEVCNAESKFSFSCHFNNLHDKELGVLLACLGVGSQSFKLKLGGGRPVGYGSIVVKLEKLSYETKERYLNWGEEGETSLAGEALSKEIEKLITASKQMIVPKQFEKLVEILTEENAPPVGLY